ncbi:GTP pyrophosphokinase [Brachybacterium hainanense]|uniref:GTP pyrophosphokinase family protein n=1 Tax=Brachybacterium hainanense TaxID=1541174 RepID=A0ABV6RFP1_9MICO
MNLVPSQLSANAVDAVRALAGPEADALDVDAMLKQIQRTFVSFRLEYKFGLDEVSTKVAILREQFDQTEDHSPIEHVKTRLKSIDSMLEKTVRRGCEPSLESIRANILDIAGMRVTCPYVEDVYLVAGALRRQEDLTILQVKDYIADPKPNGYRSLHLVVAVPVYLADRTLQVPVEVQIRTIAMDFWASAEHELRYKFAGEVPEELSRTMGEIALTARNLDEQMTGLRTALAPHAGRASGPS